MNKPLWDYETMGDPQKTGFYSRTEKYWGLYTLKDGEIESYHSKTREELEMKLKENGMKMDSKMYHHFLLKDFISGKTLISKYQYLVY